MKRATLILGVLLAGCQSQPTPPTTSDDERPQVPARGAFGFDYATWPSVTDTPHQVSPAFLMFCRAPTADEVRQQEAAKKEHGPHAESAIVVRVNPIGLDRFKSGGGVPVGTVVIKEKYYHYYPGAEPSAVAAMIKREAGYDPEHDDWEYAYEERSSGSERKVERGKIASCIECHKAAGIDYLFRPYLEGKR
jgi:hypothetical protein